MFEKAAEKRRGGRAVHIIVAENGDLFPAFNRRSQPRGRLVHIGERARIGHQALDGRIEKRRRLVNPDAPARQNAGDNVGNAVMLRNRQRDVHLAAIQPLRPALAGGGGGDVEEGAAVGHGISCSADFPPPPLRGPSPTRGEVKRRCQSPPLWGRRPQSGQRGEVKPRRGGAGEQWRRPTALKQLICCKPIILFSEWRRKQRWKAYQCRLNDHD